MGLPVPVGTVCVYVVWFAKVAKVSTAISISNRSTMGRSANHEATSSSSCSSSLSSGNLADVMVIVALDVIYWSDSNTVSN